MKNSPESVAIVDDHADARESFGYTVEDADLRPIPIEGAIGSLADSASLVRGADIVLSDYELRAKNYANFTGAELVAARQRAGQPAILCTKYEKPQIERIRPFRRWIPVLMAPDDLEPGSLLKAISKCRAELDGRFEPDRKPWRSLVRFVEADPESDGRFFVELPSWELGLMVPVHRAHLPVAVQSLIEPDFRCHAMVNLGSERYEDVYFDDWSLS